MLTSYMLLPPLTFDVDMYDRPCMVDDSKNSRRISMSKKIRQTTDKKWLQELNLIWEFFDQYYDEYLLYQKSNVYLIRGVSASRPNSRVCHECMSEAMCWLHHKRLIEHLRTGTRWKGTR